jgi:hypothetical protein
MMLSPFGVRFSELDFQTYAFQLSVFQTSDLHAPEFPLLNHLSPVLGI